MKIIVVVLLCLAAQARAASVVYDHPALKAKLTVHTIDGASSPKAVSYEGPFGHYLVKDTELFALESGDGWTPWRYDVCSFTAEGFASARVSYEKPTLSRYDDGASVKALETVIAALRSKGKEEAPDEFAARVAALRRKASFARGRWASLTTMAKAYPGTVKDAGALAQQEGKIAAAQDSIAQSAALRVIGEADAARAAATPSDPNPKADFYWRRSLALDAAARTIAETESELESQPLPAY